jgi:hypothetical protein
MGLMQQPVVAPGQLIVTPHPALLDGQRNVVWEARAGESLYAILQRNVPEMDGQRWEVCIGGVPVERHLWHCVCPKQGQVIEARGGVGKTALMIVAMIALTYFTMGAGAGWIAGTFGVAAGGFAAAAIGAGLFMAGSMLINKVLGPKPAKASNQQQDSVYSISGARNQLRPYEPIPLLFGRVRITPDLLSKPYTWYEGNDQYLGLLLSAGINVGRIDALYNADTLLTSYEGVQVYHAGYSGMPEQDIPLYSNADTIDGAELPDTAQWVQRTTSVDTVRIQINLEYILGGQGTSGKNYDVSETIVSEYRVTGATNWMPLVSRTFRSSKFDARRATLSRDVERGQYEVRVRMLGQGNYSGKNTQKNDFQWTTLTSVQVDEADYTGLSRTGICIKATGQLNGAPDEIRGVGYADPIPEWNGAAWVTKESSNPGAQCVAYARGIAREGRLLGGMQLSDEQIDLESWKAFSLHCAANGYSYNHYIKDARNHEQVLSAIALAGFGQITWAGGRLGVVWAAQEQPLSGVVNMATIKKGQFQVDYNLVNAADGIEYTYIDGATWETKTLRVPAPGVVTMLNPAQVAGEGVGTEQHAARMARWHLAQSLYQYKDIGYSTDIEHLSYQRMSLLAMQHDMTQWGYGGRVAAAVNASGTVTLTLDEPVPAPASGNSYIGLRIPGERIYRVLRVKPFTGEAKVVELADAWPSDAPLPGNASSNPAHDTLWIYDFKQTPGYRVRVTSIEPESDLKGASVRVVPEGPEFWDYVLNGHYVPAPNQSLLQTRPVASNLRVTEQQVVQGNTTFTELTATFDVTGPVGSILVLAAGQDQELLEVAQTQTRTATWRIPRADAYTIVVRPFGPDGETGIAASVTYITAGADVPPALVDLFDVQERSGGVRLYTWGWLADTMQSPDFAGVEIRYTEGNVPAPEWDAMTPIGDTGYHTVPFEAVVPQSGTWTFACRSRNTAGQLSIDMRVITRSIGANLGQQLGGIAEDLDAITQQQVVQQAAIDKEIADRIQADLNVATQAGADATDKANAARDAAIAHADVIGAQVADILEADEWVSTKTYPKGDLVKRLGKLYRALRVNTNKAPETNTADWQFIGNYTSLGEAVAASISIGTQNTSDIASTSSQLDSVVARMPAGSGKVATAASVSDAVSAAATANTAMGLRVGTIEARVPSGTGLLETKARVDQVNQARVDGDAALAQSINTVSTQAGNAQSAATSALTAANNAASVASTAQTKAEGAQSTATNALDVANGAASSVAQVKITADNASASVTEMSKVITDVPSNLIKKSLFDDDTKGGWDAASSIGTAPASGWGSQGSDTFKGKYLSASATSYESGNNIPVKPGDIVELSANLFDTTTAGGGLRLHVMVNGENTFPEAARIRTTAPGSWQSLAIRYTIPAGASAIRAMLNPVSGSTIRMTQPTIRRLSELDKKTMATHTVSLNVDGFVSGTVSENDGTRSSFSILATVFRVIGSGAEGMEWANGYLRVWKGNSQTIMGNNFGVAGQKLMKWFGPNIGAAACTKANATSWEDSDGNAYFAGQVLQGVLRFFNSNQTVSASATVETGNNASNGKPAVVSGRLVYNAIQSFPAFASQITIAGGQTVAVIAIDRQYAGEGWVELTRRTAIGNYSIVNVSDGPSTIQWGIDGSAVTTDVASTKARNYRTRIVSISRQDYTVTNPGTVPALVQTQYQSIESME